MRDMTPGVEAAIAAPVVRPVLFVELDFLSGPVRLWGGIGDFSWDGKVWVGRGDLLGIGEIEEASDGTATSLTGVLRGVASELTGAVYADQWQGRTATAWLGVFDEDFELIEEPVQIRSGIMDHLADREDAESTTFSLVVETPALDQGNNRSWRLTHEIQQQFYPGDDFLQYTVALQKTPLRWGALSAPAVAIRNVLAGWL